MEKSQPEHWSPGSESAAAKYFPETGSCQSPSSTWASPDWCCSFSISSDCSSTKSHLCLPLPACLCTETNLHFFPLTLLLLHCHNRAAFCYFHSSSLSWNPSLPHLLRACPSPAQTKPISNLFSQLVFSPADSSSATQWLSQQGTHSLFHLLLSFINTQGEEEGCESPGYAWRALSSSPHFHFISPISKAEPLHRAC